MKFFQTTIFIIFLIITGCDQPKETPQGTHQMKLADHKLKIAVIPKGTMHFYWKTVHAGADKAAEELGVEIIWQGAQKENDHEKQKELVQNFISQSVDGIVLAPSDFSVMAAPVKNAVSSNIPVVIIDSQLESEDYSSFVATDNLTGGKLCAKKLVEMMGGKGKVIMLRYVAGAASTTQREAGFFDGLKKYGPDIELVSSIQYAGVTVENAFQTSQNLLKRHPDINGIFCSNESATHGMLLALQASGKAGKVKFVGFDSSPSLIEGVRKGEIHGLAIQDPFMIGYLGVTTIVKVLREEKYNTRIDTGINFVTLENIDEPLIQKLLSPEVE
jgi:ribose transport system substrate-binding protein